MAKVTVEFDENGNPTIDVSGMDGSGCEAETRELEEALGTRAGNTRKPEYHRAPKQQQRRSL